MTTLSGHKDGCCSGYFLIVHTVVGVVSGAWDGWIEKRYRVVISTGQFILYTVYILFTYTSIYNLHTVV